MQQMLVFLCVEVGVLHPLQLPSAP
uniref:Uncharacterized protein n=1 Tax=Rhizophora mucronata TaxID=61149 RepID=A0A2P2N8W5_RHIMU